jgi:hypothetical protein
MSAPMSRRSLLRAAMVGGLALTATGIPSTATAVGEAMPNIWLNPDEISRIATSGTAWTSLTAAANGSWGAVALNNNDSTHDVLTLAGAIVAARTGDTAMRSKVAASLATVPNTTSFARVLEMSRQIPSYVFAADLIGYQDTKFDTFLTGLLTKALDGHSGGKNMLQTAEFSPNNWGTMSRAACAAIAARTGNTAVLTTVATAHRAWTGETVTNRLVYTSTTWHASTPKAGINRRGASRNGNSLDGVIPEDQRRTGESYAWPAPKGSYPWEALQGAVVAGVVLHRAGAVPFNAGDDALVRAAKWLTNVNGNPAAGDDLFLPWLLNYYGNAGLKVTSPAKYGKNAGWTDATHVPSVVVPTPTPTPVPVPTPTPTPTPEPPTC